MKEAIERLASAIIKLKQRVDRLENVRISPRGYGSIYTESGTKNAVNQTYTKVDILNTAGQYRRVTLDVVTDKDMTQAEDTENVYLVGAWANILVASNATVYIMIRSGGNDTHLWARQYATTSGYVSMYVSGLLRLTSSQAIALYVKTDNALGVNLTFNATGISMVKVS